MTRRAPAGPAISILIVNFNSSARLRRCLDSLERSTGASELQIIVVDNASDDFDATWFQDAYPQVDFHPQRANLTYTGGNNLAFEHATGDLILMLNPDTEVDRDALKNARSHLEGDPSLVGLSAYLTGSDGALQRYYRRLPATLDIPTILFERIFRTTRRGRRFLMLNESFEEPTLVEQPPGAFLMFRRASVRSTTLLDAGYFNFFSDVDLCRRLLGQGRIKAFPDVRCFHARAGAGVGTIDPAIRLRLYQDFIWGLNRFMQSGSTLSLMERTLVSTLEHAYLLSRVLYQVVRRPTAFVEAVCTIKSTYAGQPPSYP